MNDNLIWAPIEGFPGYFVNRCGQVKKVYKNNKEVIIKTRPLKTNGYEGVDLWIHGFRKTFCMHRLVAKAFIPNPDPEHYDTVDHIDCNKFNNNVDNLRWLSKRENVARATRKTVRCIETGMIFGSATEADQWLGLKGCNVSNAIYRNGLAGGYHWERYKWQ